MVDGVAGLLTFTHLIFYSLRAKCGFEREGYGVFDRFWMLNEVRASFPFVVLQ